MDPKKLTATQKKHYDRLFEVSQELIWDFQHPEVVRKYLPAEWREVRTDPTPDKTRLTLRVDTDVAKFFRKLGPGYQGTMNRVLRAFMLAKLADVLGEEPGAVAVEVTTDPVTQLAMAQEVSLTDQIAEMRRMRFGKLESKL